jgi:hypothetical protein
VAALLVLYLAGQRRNPPGFAIDESSIAYNALTMARDGVDEHGAAFPLYFRAFGEYKNPPYIYLLSGVYRVFDPGVLTGRRLSALLGVAAALALGWLGWKVSGRRSVAILTLASAALTPVLFEISRLVYEVALLPLAIALFLIAARNAYERPRWSPALVAALVGTLVLVTYTYTTGRLMGPVLALLLGLFLTRERRAGLAAVWVLYGLLLIPMLVVNQRSGGVLLNRPDIMVAGETPVEKASGIARNYLLNLDPVGFSLRGDPNPVNHVQHSGGSMLLLTPLLALIGIARTYRERWTWFLVAAALAAVVPVSMTVNVHHALRLAAYVLLLLLLSIPALEMLVRAGSRPLRGFVGLAMLAGAVQAAFFFFVFHRDGANRHFDFHHGAQQVIEDALAQMQRPIYMRPGPGYVHAYWFAALRGRERTEFAALEPGTAAPHDSIVLAGTTPPEGSIPISRHGRFGVYYVP